MKRFLSLLLCLMLLCGVLVLPVSADIFSVSYYSEAIYAGGVVDLYAFPKNGGVEPFTYQWQAEGFGWIDLEDNDVYQGTKTNHLRLYTQPGSYGDLDAIPFQCAVTDAEGDTFYTPDIHVEIYPTNNLIPNMKNWGYGLYTPSLTNVSDLKSDGDSEYTASAYAGSKINIFCGSKPAEDKDILANSEVKLTREIHITENGHTTQTGDNTTYIPYTVGTNAVTVKIKNRISIGGHDLGELDCKTIQISTTKPTVASTATTSTACSLLRYTYNESQKLTSIPKGASVEVLNKEGSYYQVFYNNYVGYIGSSLLNVQTPAYDPVIKEVDVTIQAPAAGEKPAFTCSVLTAGCQLYKIEPVTWYDNTAKKFLSSADKFTEGHSYDLSIWLAAKSGYKFQLDSSNKPKLSGSINGNLPPFINKAYEQDPEEVVELTYTFHNVKAKEPELTHTCAPVLVEKVEPTCTEAGHKAYYYCSCGMHYKDAQGKNDVDISTWGILPATGHKRSDWRITGAYHYIVCTTCGEFLEQEDHKGGKATCVAKGVCAVCGEPYQKATENHIPDTSKWIARAEMYHFHACKLCGAHCDIEDHRWSPTYLYQDKTGHAWICADCKAVSKVEPHNPGPAATETTPQTCKDCSYIITPAKNHTHILKKAAQTPATCTQEGNIEYYTCDGCSELFADAAGKRNIPDTMSVSVAALGHTASEDVSFDTEYHWRRCTTCNEVIEKTKLFHEMEHGVCTACGYQAGTEPVPQTLPPVETSTSSESSQQENAKGNPQEKAASKENEQVSIGPLAAVLTGVTCFAAAITTTVIVAKRKR